MTLFKAVAIAIALAFPALSAHANDYKTGDLSIAHPHSFATPPGATTAAGYLAITNNGTSPDRLVGIESNFPRAMIHRSEMEDGIMKMRHQKDGVVIPAGETVTFEPGGLHLMFLGLEQQLKVGEKAEVKLKFENSGSVAVTFNVEKRNVTLKAVDHSHHGGHSKKKEPAEIN